MAGVDDADVERLRSLDPAAFRRVYEALAPTVQGYARARGSADPEGLTQEVFLTVFRRSEELTGGASGLRSFVFSVAHARLVDELRARGRRLEPVAFDPEDDARTTPSAEVEATARLTREAVLGLLAALPEGQREAVALRIVAGLSLEETAAVLDRSVGAVKQLQRRGLLALRAEAEQGGVTP